MEGVEKQINTIFSYISERQINGKCEVYIDDGFSETDFNRSDFLRLLNDMKNGKINTILVKDLSRFGRNYIEVGNYLEQVFPLYKIRFIAINDNIDSF